MMSANIVYNRLFLSLWWQARIRDGQVVKAEWFQGNYPQKWWCPSRKLERLSTSHHPTAKVFSLIIISFSISPSSLILSEVLQPLHSLCCTSSLKRLPKDLRQFVSHPSILISPIFHLHSPMVPLTTEVWTLQTMLSGFYFLLMNHHTPAITTDCNRSPRLSPRLDLPGFCLATKRNEKIGYCGLELVKRRWISWSTWRYAQRSFTLHYIEDNYDDGFLSVINQICILH